MGQVCRRLQRGAGLQPAGHGIGRQVANLLHAACYLNGAVFEPYRNQIPEASNKSCGINDLRQRVKAIRHHWIRF